MIDFSTFLQAKYALDGRSINQTVWRLLADKMTETKAMQILDVGTGAGAMLKRLLNLPNPRSLTLTGLDNSPSLLEIAKIEIISLLSDQGYAMNFDNGAMTASLGEHRININLIDSCLSTFQTQFEYYDLITAHAFMDLVPLKETISQFNTWLKPGGLFYSAINYDGQTVLFPPFEDTCFERQLLEAYDTSMEKRRINGQHTGGAHCGRRLFLAVQQTGLEILAYGSSDWNITPVDGKYQDQDSIILRYLLYWINKEGEASSSINNDFLDHWYDLRQQQLNANELGIIVHQLDIVARKE